MQVTLLFLVGIGSGRATDAGYFRHCFIAGAVLQVLGVMATSAATEFWQLLLAQGIAFGIGAGLVFTPTTALLSTYFDKRRSFVMGIAAAGSSTGGLIFPAIVRELLPRIGFPWTVRVVGKTTRLNDHSRGSTLTTKGRLLHPRVQHDCCYIPQATTAAKEIGSTC